MRNNSENSNHDLTIDFLDIARVMDYQSRFCRLKEFLKAPFENIDHRTVEINYILDFLTWWYYEWYESEKSIRKNDIFDWSAKIDFFGAILHSYLPSDLHGLLILVSSGLYHQANVLLRRTVEYILFSVWLDLTSKFGNLFEFYWDSNEWKPSLRHQKVKNKDLKKKWRQLYELNKTKGETLPEFKKRYFKEGIDLDFILLFSKRICKECNEKQEQPGLFINVNMSEVKLNGNQTTKEELNEMIQSRFIHELSINCDYCGKCEATALVLHLPDLKVIFTLLKHFIVPQNINALSHLKQLYNCLSSYYVHFSMDPYPSRENALFKIGKEEIDLHGFGFLHYALQKLSCVLCNYFMIKKNAFEVYEYPDECEVRKRDFHTFNVS